MPRYAKEGMAAHEVEIARHLFDKIVDAEAGSVASGDMRKHLLETWHEVAEAVMRPIQSRVELEQAYDRLQDERTTVPF